MAGLGDIRKKVKGATPAGAVFDEDVVPGTRGNIFPAAQYTDGRYHLAWPQVLMDADTDAITAEAAQSRALGNVAPQDQDPEHGKQLAGASFNASGLAALGSVGAVPEGAVAANGVSLASKVKGWFGGNPYADTQGIPPDVYARIIKEAEKRQAFLSQLPEGEQPFALTGHPFEARMYRGSGETRLYDDDMDKSPPWASSSPREAHTYADGQYNARVAPLDVRFQNPMVVDAMGEAWTGVPYSGGEGFLGKMSTDDIVRDIADSYPNVDGVVFQNVLENLDKPSTSIQAIHRGTIFSPLTGKQLYANPPTGASVPLAFSEDPQAEGYASGGSVTLDDFMKRHEGFAPRAQWDYAQHTNGYGTKARYPGEEISREEAELRFQAEKAQARAIVERFAPQLDEGSKAALTDLTYNAGDKWTRSGLGEAVRSGDLDRAKSLYLQYTKAGGETLPGLVRRRQEGAALFGSQMPDQTPRLAQSAPQGDFFADKPLTLAGNEMPAWGPPMALGGPEEPNISAEAKSSPFNAQSYRVAPEHQGRHSDYMKDPSGADWVQGPLGLMPKYSDGSMPLQGFAEGGMVRLETPLQGGNGVSSAMGELQPGYSGPLHSEIAGRTDEIPLEVSSGSYIVPADIVSALGQGNTLAGSKILQQMFPSEAPTLQFSSGGRVPIIVAGGEFALSPEQVAKIGGGDLNAGHSALDEWIGAVRAHTIQTLSSLPPPATE